jgi:hypothetical protein
MNNEARQTIIHSFMLTHGIDQFKMELIKQYDVIDKQHLRVFETLWICRTKCINKYVAFNPIPLGIRNKIWHDNNRDAVIERRKVYYQNNKHVMLERSKAYQKENRQSISKREKAYREKNRESIQARKSEKYSCSCGGKYTRNSKAQHFKTQKHVDWMSNQPLTSTPI